MRRGRGELENRAKQGCADRLLRAEYVLGMIAGAKAHISKRYKI
jgi:hypothetical protein